MALSYLLVLLSVSITKFLHALLFRFEFHYFLLSHMSSPGSYLLRSEINPVSCNLLLLIMNEFQGCNPVKDALNGFKESHDLNEI